jgi:hypothetical protein
MSRCSSSFEFSNFLFFISSAVCRFNIRESACDISDVSVTVPRDERFSIENVTYREKT